MQTLLIVEDNQDLRNIYKMSFDDAGIDTIILDNGLDALAQIKKINPALVLLDLLMPDIDGIRFMKTISLNGSLQYPVIVCTNLSSEGTMEECMSLGCVEFIIKSRVDTRDIVQKVIAYLEAHKEVDIIAETPNADISHS